MAKQTLAVKYRPHSFDSVTEQNSIKLILQQQLESGEFKNAYLFVGGAGTGKTTTARIFANEINNHVGVPIELDAASNSSVEDVRNIIQQAKTKSLDSEYKVFIIDECHSLSNTAWQAFLKLIEEPPAKSVFIFCTTNPEKIPKTILSRVQRFDFRRISQNGIVDRLSRILMCEEEQLMETGAPDGVYRDSLEDGALEYIAKLADGGMRDAITMMDKCLSYSSDLTIDNIVKALGVADYDIMCKLTMNYIIDNKKTIIELIEQIHSAGIDLKQFIRQYINFVLDIKKYAILENFEYLQLPQVEQITTMLKDIVNNNELDIIDELLDKLLQLNTDIKYDSAPKYIIEAVLIGG